MKLLKLLFFLIFLANLSTTVYSQKIVAFNKRGIVKRVRYYEGDLIKLKTVDNQKYIGVISSIQDSSFYISTQEVQLKNVKRVYNTQKLQGLKLLSRVGIRGGLAYLPLVSFNRAINKDEPIVTQSAILVSGTFLSVSIVSYLIYNHSYKISSNRPLMILNLTL